MSSGFAYNVVHLYVFLLPWVVSMDSSETWGVAWLWSENELHFPSSNI